MAAERCPLCQGKLKNGECLSCGYRPPDEGDISALYNYDPTDYPQPQAVREITPDVRMEEIYPNRPEIPDIKVHDEQNQTIGKYGTGANQAAWQQAKQAQAQQQAKQAQQVQQAQQIQQRQQAQQNNPYANNGSFTPYQSPVAPKNIPTNLPPVLGGNLPTPTNQDTVNSFGEFFRKYWWALLLSLFVPFLGLIFYAIYQHKLDKKYNILFIVAFFVGRILFL